MSWTSASGPSRHFAWAQQSGRFWREADINRQAELAGLVANDPYRKCGGSLLTALCWHLQRPTASVERVPPTTKRA
jgi:hypothetical protein